MKNSVKYTAIAVFGVLVLGLFLRTVGASGTGYQSFSPTMPSPTPPAANATKPAATPPAAPPANAGNSTPGDKTIPKTFTLSTDSQSEYGESPFNHENHAFQKYSPDGTAVMGCVECHHTDQPKSALKPPLMTSERDVTMTFETWKASSQKVTDCRACHFQDGNVPEGKEMPKATYTEGDKTTTKTLNNELAYHINCNNCHDAAFKARPDLKKKPGFATGKDCAVCHKTT
jgi:cytochrome c553